MFTNVSIHKIGSETISCNFSLLYLSDGTKIYQSENLMPSERITNITLLEPLQKGLYKNCRIVYECFDLQTNAPLNGGQMTIEIQSR